MNNEIEVPSFVNDNYNKKKEEKQKRIENLKIYKKTIKLIAFGATLGLVVAAAPKIEQTAKNAVVNFIEHDNHSFEQEKQQEINEIEQSTGRSIEEITESGRTK